MASTSPHINTEPLPGQFLGRRGRKLSWEKKGFIWDRKRQSLEIRKIKNIDPSEYMTCNLPSQPDCINIFLDSKTESEAFVGTSMAYNADKVLIGRLNLQRLGIGERLSRRFGNYQKLYIAKDSLSESGAPDFEEDDNAGPSEDTLEDEMVRESERHQAHRMTNSDSAGHKHYPERVNEGAR